MIKKSAFLVSIIIATFNAEDEIGECLSSINQYAPDMEIIVVDGKSSDKTLSVIESKKMQNLMVSSERDKGIYDALNKGIAKLSTIGFLNILVNMD